MKYKPPFTITPVILRLVSEISELVGHVQALSGSTSPFLRKENWIWTIHPSLAIENNTLPQVLNHVDIHKGDVFFIEAGTVHAIGKGALIAEIQQNSNVTYRVYDYDRRGADGKPRELHVAKALDVAVPEPPKYDTQPMGQKENIGGGSRQLLARCPLFTVYHYAVSDTVQLTAGAESFQHILVTDGNGTIDGRLLQKGDSFLVPAGYGNFAVSGQLEMLVTSI